MAANSFWLGDQEFTASTIDLPKFWIRDIQTVWKQLVKQHAGESTTITLATVGTPDEFEWLVTLGDVSGPEVVKARVKGVYHLGVLLQELTLGVDRGWTVLQLSVADFLETPVDRLRRVIRTRYWGGLLRRLDGDNLINALIDSKRTDEQPRLYIPSEDLKAIQYYQELTKSDKRLENLIVQPLTSEALLTIDLHPGLLALAVRENGGKVEPIPYVVPGGRFNEMYGWDSYFEALGLLADNQLSLAKGMADHFIYEITYYGKILNANRSYYLTRSQPPFFTDFVTRIVEKELSLGSTMEGLHLEWLRLALQAAIKEYTFWTTGDHYVSLTGLSRYFDTGRGMPRETEPGAFRDIFDHFHVNLDDYIRGTVQNSQLDAYFSHDRAMRESGHDTSDRLVGLAASLNTADLNCLLFKYECQIALLIERFFNGSFDGVDCQWWIDRSELRRSRINQYCWNEELGYFLDYNFELKQQQPYRSATALYALWSGVATQTQAERIVNNLVVELEANGGLLAGACQSRLRTEKKYDRQWDFPFGWAPHQILCWGGLELYNFPAIKHRLIYKWLFAVLQTFQRYNGTVPEKLDVVDCTHLTNVEYGNVGTDFQYVNKEGFGWTNASVQVGWQMLPAHYQECLRQLQHPSDVFSLKNKI